MNELELWLPIAGYEGLYSISCLGRVISHARKWVGGHGGIRIKKETILSQGITTRGYLHVALCRNGKVKTILTHILVAKYFIANPKNKPQVNHKYGNKLDNRWHQLEWATSKENHIHAFKTGLRVTPKGQIEKMWKASIKSRFKTKHLQS